MPELLDPPIFRLRQFPPNEISTSEQRSRPPVPGPEPDDDLYRERHQCMFGEFDVQALRVVPNYPLIIHVIRDRGRSDNRREQLTDRLDKLAGLIAFGIPEVEDIVITQCEPLGEEEGRRLHQIEMIDRWLGFIGSGVPKKEDGLWISGIAVRPPGGSNGLDHIHALTCERYLLNSTGGTQY